ncbi:MAG: DUF2304 domain-containing protein [Candidatus Woesebacteria bacterium]|jgi:hypothetical protein
MNIFQIIAICFAIFMMYVVRINQKRLKFKLIESSFWYSTWLVFIVIALFPNLLKGITNVLHFARVFDLLIVIALMIITTIVIINFFTQRKNQKKLEDFIRQEAIKKTKKND